MELERNERDVLTCPECGAELLGYQYEPGTPEAYDGVSEWICLECELRIGRWSMRSLLPGERERRYSGGALGRAERFIESGGDTSELLAGLPE